MPQKQYCEVGHCIIGLLFNYVSQVWELGPGTICQIEPHSLIDTLIWLDRMMLKGRTRVPRTDTMYRDPTIVLVMWRLPSCISLAIFVPAASSAAMAAIRVVDIEKGIECKRFSKTSMSPLRLIRKIAVWGCSQGKFSICSKQYYARYRRFSTRYGLLLFSLLFISLLIW